MSSINRSLAVDGKFLEESTIGAKVIKGEIPEVKIGVCAVCGKETMFFSETKYGKIVCLDESCQKIARSNPSFGKIDPCNNQVPVENYFDDFSTVLKKTQKRFKKCSQCGKADETVYFHREYRISICSACEEELIKKIKKTYKNAFQANPKSREKNP